MINVKDHGVEGDGVTDDSGALQDLIDNAQGTLYFPPGRYRIDEKLIFYNKTGYHLVGSGLAPPLPQGSGAVGARSQGVFGYGFA